MQFLAYETFNVFEVFKEIPKYQELDQETINAILEEGGKFATEVLLPLNKVGDIEGCSLNPITHAVKTPTGFKDKPLA